MQFTTILSLAAATLFQLVSADVHSQCWCETQGSFDLSVTGAACLLYPQHLMFNSNEAAMMDSSTVKLRVSSSAEFQSCTSFDGEIETPRLGGKEFSAACLLSAPAGVGVKSKCN